MVRHRPNASPQKHLFPPRRHARDVRRWISSANTLQGNEGELLQQAATAAMAVKLGSKPSYKQLGRRGRRRTLIPSILFDPSISAMRGESLPETFQNIERARPRHLYRVTTSRHHLLTSNTQRPLPHPVSQITGFPSSSSHRPNPRFILSPRPAPPRRSHLAWSMFIPLLCTQTHLARSSGHDINLLPASSHI